MFERTRRNSTTACASCAPSLHPCAARKCILGGCDVFALLGRAGCWLLCHTAWQGRVGGAGAGVPPGRCSPWPANTCLGVCTATPAGHMGAQQLTYASCSAGCRTVPAVAEHLLGCIQAHLLLSGGRLARPCLAVCFAVSVHKACATSIRRTVCLRSSSWCQFSRLARVGMGQHPDVSVAWDAMRQFSPAAAGHTSRFRCCGGDAEFLGAVWRAVCLL